MAWLVLFMLCFMAATIVPFSSEALLTLMIFNGYDPFYVILTATAGNFSGGMSSYALGYIGKWEWLEKYFKIPYNKIQIFSNKINRWGSISAFFTWLPLVGDIIAVALGFLRCNFWLTALFMLSGKFIRYLVWMYLNLELMHYAGWPVF